MAAQSLNISPQWVCKQEQTCYITPSDQTVFSALDQNGTVKQSDLTLHFPPLRHALFLLFHSVSNHLIAPLKVEKKKKQRLSFFLPFSPSLH